MALIAHRCSYSKHKENTIAGLIYSFQVGCHGVELDVRSCVSGEIFVLHDDTLSRTTKGIGEIRSKSYNECIELNIPTLNDIIKIIDDMNEKRIFFLFIDMKEDNLWLEILNKIANRNYIWVKSYSPQIIKNMHNYNPIIKLAYIVDTDNECKNISDIVNFIDIISINYKTLNLNIMEMIKYMNKKLFIWTIDNVISYNYIKFFNPDFICTGYPEIILS